MSDVGKKGRAKAFGARSKERAEKNKTAEGGKRGDDISGRNGGRENGEGKRRGERSKNTGRKVLKPHKNRDVTECTAT